MIATVLKLLPCMCAGHCAHCARGCRTRAWTATRTRRGPATSATWQCTRWRRKPSGSSAPAASEPPSVGGGFGAGMLLPRRAGCRRPPVRAFSVHTTSGKQGRSGEEYHGSSGNRTLCTWLVTRGSAKPARCCMGHSRDVKYRREVSSLYQRWRWVHPPPSAESCCT